MDRVTRRPYYEIFVPTLSKQNDGMWYAEFHTINGTVVGIGTCLWRALFDFDAQFTKEV